MQNGCAKADFCFGTAEFYTKNNGRKRFSAVKMLILSYNIKLKELIVNCRNSSVSVLLFDKYRNLDFAGVYHLNVYL